VGGDDVAYFVDSVFGGVDERPFDMSAEGFGSVFCDAVCARGTQEGECLFISIKPLILILI
jgi:hypothetical protein